MAADRDRVLAEVQSAAEANVSVPLNLAAVTFSGPGGTGKKSACLAIQGKPLSAQRESTRGGDGMALVVRVKKQELLGFEEPRDALSHLQHALLQRLERERGISARWNEGNEDAEVDIAPFVSSLDAYGRIAELQAQLEAMGGGLTAAVMEEPTEMEEAAADMKAHGPTELPLWRSHGNIPSSTSPELVRQIEVRTPRLAGLAKASRRGTTASMVVIPEQIQVKREAAIVMRAQQAADGREDQDANLRPGRAARVLAAGGRVSPRVRIICEVPPCMVLSSPLFISLTHFTVVPHSKAIISVFGRLDELAANVLRNTSIASDSSMRGFDELFLWSSPTQTRPRTRPTAAPYPTPSPRCFASATTPWCPA
jgi:hypothetical protein